MSNLHVIDEVTPLIALPLNEEDNLSEDNPLKEIYSGQTFSTFEILEQCLINTNHHWDRAGGFL
jgi:hypothetical protein